ncbi:hypothetical protein [Streptomyces subrutilus]
MVRAGCLIDLGRTDEALSLLKPPNPRMPGLPDGTWHNNPPF